MATKIFIGNYKGGVGKTTSTFYLAAEFSKQKNCKVLLIDLDPQCSLSEICARSCKNLKSLDNIADTETFNTETLNYALDMLQRCHEININPNFTVGNFIKSCDNLNSQKKCTVDFIPASIYYKHSPQDNEDIGLDGLIELFQKDTDRNILLLPEFVNLLERERERDYGFIIFDCPPSNNVLTKSAFLMSDFYLIPYISDVVSTKGVGHYIKTITKVYKTFCEEHENVRLYKLFFGKKPEPLGIFECMRKGNANPHGNLEIELCRFKVKLHKFETIIKHFISIPEFMGEGEASYEADYGKLAKEILERIDELKAGARD